MLRRDSAATPGAEFMSKLQLLTTIELSTAIFDFGNPSATCNTSITVITAS